MIWVFTPKRRFDRITDDWVLITVPFQSHWPGGDRGTAWPMILLQPAAIFGNNLTHIQGTGDQFQPKPLPRGQGTADVNKMVQ
jgi:hypothetical protein